MAEDQSFEPLVQALFDECARDNRLAEYVRGILNQPARYPDTLADSPAGAEADALPTPAEEVGSIIGDKSDPSSFGLLPPVPEHGYSFPVSEPQPLAAKYSNSDETITLSSPTPTSHSEQGPQVDLVRSNSLFPPAEIESRASKSSHSLTPPCLSQAANSPSAASAVSSSSGDQVASTTPLASTSDPILEHVKAICDAQRAASDKMFEEKIPSIEAERLRRCRPKRRMPKRSRSNEVQQNVVQSHHEYPQFQYPQGTPMIPGLSTAESMILMTPTIYQPQQTMTYPTYAQLPIHYAPVESPYMTTTPFQHPAGPLAPTIPAAYEAPLVNQSYHSVGAYYYHPNQSLALNPAQQFSCEFEQEATLVQFHANLTMLSGVNGPHKRRYEEVQEFESNDRNVRSRTEYNQTW